MKKRIISLILALTMAVPNSIPAFADDINTSENVVDATLNDTEIDNITSEDMDFSSKRLFVLAGEYDIREEENIVSDYDGSYLLQYDTEEEAKDAYEYYEENALMVEPDMPIHIAEEASDDVSGENIQNMDMNIPEDSLAQSVAESGEDKPVIALIDTGVNDSANVIEKASMLDDNGDDMHGHGTRMFSYITSQDPDAKVISIKALDSNGNGSTASICAAIQYAEKSNANIILLPVSSLKTSDTQILEDVINDASSKGITVIAAAGNSNRDASLYTPSNISAATIIGACDENGEKKDISNYGSTVDYYVVANSTSQASALFAGHISKYGCIVNPDHSNLIYTAAYVWPGMDAMEDISDESNKSEEDADNFTDEDAPFEEATDEQIERMIVYSLDEDNNFIVQDAVNLPGSYYIIKTRVSPLGIGIHFNPSNGQIMYCTEVDCVNSYTGTYTSRSGPVWYQMGNRTKSAIAYIIGNGVQKMGTRCINRKYRADSSQSWNVSGKKVYIDYTITACAVWCTIYRGLKQDPDTRNTSHRYGDGQIGTGNNGREINLLNGYGNGDAVRKSNALLNDAWNYSNSNRNGYWESNELKLNNAQNAVTNLGTMHENGDFYESDKFYVSNTYGRQLELAVQGTTGAKLIQVDGEVETQTANPATPDDTTVEYLDRVLKRGYKLQISKNNASKLGSNPYTFTINVTGGTKRYGVHLYSKGQEQTQVLATYDAVNTTTLKATVKLDIPQGKLYVQKATANSNIKNDGTHYSFKNAKYTVYKDSACTQTVGTLITNDNGRSQTISLDPGTYYVKETKAPIGYELNDKKYTVVIKRGETTAVSESSTKPYALENPYKHGSLEIKKLDELFGNKLTGAEFTLYEKVNGNYVRRKTITDDNGDGIYETGELYASAQNKAGEYRIIETKAPDGYEAAFSYTFTLPASPKKLSVIAKNPPKPIEVRLTKLDEENEDIKLSDAVFRVYSLAGDGYTNDLGTMTWDASMEVFKASVQADETNQGWFKIVEEQAPPQYEGSYETTFQIISPQAAGYAKDGETFYVPITATNRKMREHGIVSLQKQSSVSNKNLGDAVFEVYQWDAATNAYQTTPCDRLVYNEETKKYESSILMRYDSETDRELIDAEGNHVVQNNGKFKVVEAIPPSGYANSEFSMEFEVIKNGDYENAQVFTPPNGDPVLDPPTVVKIRKVDVNGNGLNGVKYAVWKRGTTDRTTYTSQRVEGEDGWVILANDDNPLPPGEYCFEETQALPGYELNTAIRRFVIDEQGKVNGTTSYTFTDVNSTIMELLITKKDSNTNNSTGLDKDPETQIEYSQKFPQGTTFKITEFSTAANGYLATPYLTVKYNGTKFVDQDDNPIKLLWTEDNQGKYQITETTATEGYILDDTPKNIVVPKTPAAGQTTISVEFANKPNHVQIYKIGKGDTPLAGVTFNIWYQDEIDKVYTGTTKANGYIDMYRLRPGVWHYQETSVGAENLAEGYVPDPDVHSFLVTDTMRIRSADGAENDEMTFTVINTIEKQLKIIKKDATTGLEYDLQTDFPKGTEFDIYAWNDVDEDWEKTPAVHVVHENS